MKRHIYAILVITLLGVPGFAHAAAPDLLPPLSMLVDSGDIVTATGMDFLAHPQSGSVNFNPNNYDIFLSGGIKLPVQDVVAYNGVKQPLKDCEDFAKTLVDSVVSYLSFIMTKLAPIIGIQAEQIDPVEITKMKAVSLGVCTNLAPDKQMTFLANKAIPYQILADIRNTAGGVTDLVFSGQSVDPYTAGFPLAGGSTGVTVDLGPVAGTEGVVIGSPRPFISLAGGAGNILPWNTPMLTASLNLFRFGPKILQFNSYSSAWLDRPLGAANNITNPACFQASNADLKFPVVPKSDAELLKAGCVGEGDVVAIVAPHFFTNSNPDLEDQNKSKDLVVLSRSPMGDPKNPASKIGYLTIYKRTNTVPTDTSIFQDLWQFDKSVTNPTFGIPEPYGIAVVKNWDAKTGKFTEGVVAGSNKLQGASYYVYYYINNPNGTEPKAILVGGVNVPGVPGFDGFGPYRAYSADTNDDKCGDILITRARISPDGKTIAFADYFDVHLQDKMTTGECRGTFDKIGTKYQIAPIDPTDPKKPIPQISSLAIADFNKDGLSDVVAGDFTTYENKTTGLAENVVYFLENKGGGLFNTVQPPSFVVNTKTHGGEVGVIDVKADTHANLGTVIAEPPAFGSYKILMPNPCAIDPNTGKVDPEKIDPATCAICSPTGDDDLDGFGDFPNNAIPVKVKTCINGTMTEVFMALDTTLFKYTPDCSTPQIYQIKTGRQWMHEWTGCDNCSASVGGVACKGPEAGAPAGANACWNKSQTDKDGDGYGDVCTTKPSFMKECGVGAGTIFDDKWLTQVPGNDSDQDGIPDCVVFQFNPPKTSFCKAPCDNCSKHYAPDQATKDACAADPSKCANPDQSETNDETGIYGNVCLPKPQNPSFEPPPPPSFKGHEVTVLLNKSKITPTPPPCANGDLECICKQNPDLHICKCLKDPNAPGCKPEPISQVSCCLDVCRGDLTAPFPAMCDFVRPYNDQIRKITGLCMDVLVPVEGTQYHLSCTMPNAPALDLGAGLAYAQVFNAAGGQIPKNYFKHWQKPVASQNLLKNNVLLNPADAAAGGGVQLDVSKLPKPDFYYDASLSAVAPDISINQAPGITQIDGIMQIETYLADVDPSTGAPMTKQAVGMGGAVPPVAKALITDIKGYSTPSGCQWVDSDCPEGMANTPPPQAFVDVIQAKVSEFESAGKPITIDTINEAFKSMDVGPAFMHQKFVVAGGQGTLVVPIQNVMGGFSQEGGCGCTFATASTMHNTVLPLLMAATALGGMFVLRRKSAKKR